jgi:hypothetical protein
MRIRTRLLAIFSMGVAATAMVVVSQKSSGEWLLAGVPGSVSGLGTTYGTVKGSRFRTSAWVIRGVSIGESKKLMRDKFRVEDGWSFAEGKGFWSALNQQTGVLVTGGGLEGDPNFGLQSYEPVSGAELGVDWMKSRGQLRNGEFESCYINGMPPDSSSPFLK